MKELELLKKDWKKNANSFQQVSENEIYKMIHKSSSSVVKWIMIIGIIEFVIVTSLGFFVADDNYTRSLERFHIDTLMSILTLFNYIVVIGFIFLFYKNFKMISTTDSARKLMKSILKARKTVQYYVWYNLSMFVLIFIVMLVSYCIYDEKTSKLLEKLSGDENSTGIWIGFFAGIFVVFAVMFALFWLFYKLVYGLLMRKLYRNYEELKKIDL